MKKPDTKTYLLKAAEKYEKHGFLMEAAQIYGHFDQQKKKELILKVAKKAEKHRLWALLADCYELIGDEEKTRSVWKNIAAELKAGNAPQELIDEAVKKSQPAVKNKL